MTTCAECLATLSTTRLSEISGDSAVAAHVQTCPSCSRLVTEMKFAEQRLAVSLDDSIPTMPPTQVAADAIVGSEKMRRESVAKWIRRGLAFSAGIMFVFFMRTDLGQRIIGSEDFRRQTVELRCISPQAAMDLATPLLRSRRGRIYTAKGLNIVTVQGEKEEIAQVLAQIDQVDNPSRCALPGSTAPTPAPVVSPEAEKPGKD